MRLSSRLSERAPGETEVVASTELNVTGILAQMGRGMVQDVGDQIVEKFTAAMRAELEAPPREAAPAAGDGGTPAPRAAQPAAPAPPLDVLALGAGAAGRAAGRSLRRPEVWVALAILALLASWLVLRARS